MSHRFEATCGVPSCSRRAVYACSTDEATIVLCCRHLERWLDQQGDEREGGECLQGDQVEAAA